MWERNGRLYCCWIISKTFLYSLVGTDTLWIISQLKKMEPNEHVLVKLMLLSLNFTIASEEGKLKPQSFEQWEFQWLSTWVSLTAFPCYLKLFVLWECGKVLSFQTSELELKTWDSLPGLMKVIYCLPGQTRHAICHTVVCVSFWKLSTLIWVKVHPVAQMTELKKKEPVMCIVTQRSSKSTSREIQSEKPCSFKEACTFLWEQTSAFLGRDKGVGQFIS